MATRWDLELWEQGLDPDVEFENFDNMRRDRLLRGLSVNNRLRPRPGMDMPVTREEYYADKGFPLPQESEPGEEEVRLESHRVNQPPGPPPPHIYATNIPGTAQQWQEEGKLTGDNLRFLTNTPEETAEAKTKGIGDWGKIIGPPEASVKPKKQTASPFPGKPPADDELKELRAFDQFWGVYANEKYGGQDPLRMNLQDVRSQAEKPLRESEAQFIHDYEKYGPEQLGKESVNRYKRLMEGIKQAGDLAEGAAKQLQAQAQRDQTQALEFFKARQKEGKGTYQVVGHNEKTGQPILQNTQPPFDTKAGQGIPGVRPAPGRAGKAPDDEDAFLQFKVSGGTWYDAKTPREFVYAGKDKYTTESIARRLIDAGHDPNEIRRAMLAEGLPEKEIQKAFSRTGPGTAGSTGTAAPSGKSPAGAQGAGKALDQGRAMEFLRQAGWNGQGRPTEAQKQAARAMAIKEGYR